MSALTHRHMLSDIRHSAAQDPWSSCCNLCGTHIECRYANRAYKRQSP